MRVLINTSTFPLRVDDGFPRFIADLAEALTRHCEVTVLAPGAPGAPSRERVGGVDVRRFTYLYPRRWQSLAYGHGIRANLRGSSLRKLQALPFVWFQTRATRALVRALRIDVINSHWIISSGLASTLARESSGSPRHVLSVHAADVYLLARLPFGQQLARFIIGRTDFVFADGSHLRNSLDRLIGRPSCAVLQPMGAHLTLFRNRDTDGAPTTDFPDGHLLFIGRLSEKKGLVYLLRALPKVLERQPGLGLIVIGYGPLEDELRREMASLGIGGSVAFIGRKSHPEIARYLRRSRLAVVPSIVDRYGEADGMPTVVIEAMASGTRVVASAVDGIPDVIRHGINGWLCREKDPQDLAEKIQVALEECAPSQIDDRIRETADRFDWTEVATRYDHAFRAVLKSGGL